MKIMICVPCLETLDVEFVRSLTSLQTVGETCLNFAAGSLVYTSREKLAEESIRNQTDFTLWLDSDMTFEPGLLVKMLKDIEENDLDMVTALCFRRRPPYTPPIWKKLRMGATPEENEEIGFNDYPENDLFEVEACGFAAVLMKTEVLAKVFNHDKLMFIPMIGYGEDISFCLRARRNGFKIHCDSRIKVGHVGRLVVGEDTFKAWNKKEN